MSLKTHRFRQAVVLAGLAALWVPQRAAAQDAHYPDPADVASVDAIMEALYDVISGPEGQPRNWDRFHSLLTPACRFAPIVRAQDGSHRHRSMTAAEFVSSTAPYFDRYGFYEIEVARTEERYGNLVHAFSTYESYRSMDEEPFQRGINSVQLLFEDSRWWIANITWQPEWADLPLPGKYLPALQLEPATAELDSGSQELLIGISPVSESVVWVSGTGGTYGRTLDGGTSWELGVVPGADSLQFRDVHGVAADTAYLLSIGSGEQSRIYKTESGGADWQLQFVNAEPAGFFDCMGFWDAHSGIAFSDSFDGSFYVIATADGGATWKRVPPEVLPAARPGEGSFAASGHCLSVSGDSTVWIGTGANESGFARVLRSTDRGRSWAFAETPLPAGATSGFTSMAFAGRGNGAALGGDVADMESLADNVALTEDGGRTWALAPRPSFPGPVYGATYVPGAPVPTLVAVGPMGVAVTADQGASWQTLSTENHWSVAFASPHVGWAIGMDGRITRIALYR